MKKNAQALLITGLLSILGGVIAVLNPLAATITIELLVGWLFTFLGGLQLFIAWKGRGFFSARSLVIGGLVFLFLGLLMLYNPLKGAVALTVILGVFLLCGGFSRISLAYMWKSSPFFLISLASGVLSVVLAIMIFFDIGNAATTILGLLLGIELISNGIVLALLSRKLS